MSDLAEYKKKKLEAAQEAAKKPTFPRPSSHYPREALKNRLLPRNITELQAAGTPYIPMRPSEDPPLSSMTNATGKRMLKGAPLHNINQNREALVNTDIKTVTTTVEQGPRLVREGELGDGVGSVQSIANTDTTSSMTMKLEHVNMPRMLHKEGMEKVAENLATDDRIFTYLTHAQGGDGNPYNFKFADQAPTDLSSAKYVTLSYKGISRAGESSLDIHEGKARIELETIDAVTLEARQFVACRKIRFFKNFRLWKPFQMWRRGIRNYLWRKRRKNISNKIYASQPMVNALIMLTVQCCQEIKALRPLRYSSGDAYDLLVFLHQQKQLQRESRKKYREILDKLLYVLCMEGDRLTLNTLQNLPPVIKALNMPKQPTIKELKDQAFLTSIVESVGSMPSNKKGVKQGGKRDELGSIAEEKSEVNLAYPPQNYNYSNSESQIHNRGEVGSFPGTASVVTTIGSVDNLGRPSFDLHSLHLPPRFGSSVLTGGPRHSGGISVSHSHFLSNMDSINDNSTTSGLMGSDKGLDNIVQGMETSVVYAEKDMTYTEKGAIRNKCRQMHAFYRMVALMLRDAHYDALERTYQDQFDFLTGHEKAPRPPWRSIDIQKRIDDKTKAERDRRKVEAEEAKATAVAVEEMIANRDDAEAVANAVEHMNAKKHRHLIKTAQTNENEGYLDDREIQSTALHSGVFRLVLVMDEMSTFKETIASAAKARMEARNVVLGGQEQATIREEMLFGDDSMASLEDDDMAIDDEPDTFTMRLDDIYSPPCNRTRYALTTYPTRSSVEKSFQSLMNSTKEVFGEVCNFLSESAFEALFYPIRDELDELDAGNGLFMDTSNSINELSSKSVDIVRRDFQQCLECLSKYQFLVEFYHENIELQQDTEALELKLRDTDTDDIADMISKCEAQLKQCETLEEQEIIGILSLDLSIAKEKCITTLTDSRNLLMTLVPQLYIYHAGSFLTDIERVTKKLRSGYEQLEIYVEVVRLYRKTVLEKETYDHMYLHVQSILRLIEEECIPHNTQSLHLVNTLGKSWHDFEDSLADFEDNMPENTKLCGKDILIRAKALTERSQESRLFLNQQQIKDPTSKSDLMIDEFSRLVVTMEAIVKEADLLEVYQMETNCSVFSKHAIVEIYDECTSNQILWIVTQSITMAYNDLFASEFLDVKPDYFYRLLNESRCKIATEMKLRNNLEVEAHVFTLMEYIDRVLPVLSMMRSIEIKSRHQNMLKALLRNDSIFGRNEVLEADDSHERDNDSDNKNRSVNANDDGPVTKEDDTRAGEGVETSNMRAIVEEESNNNHNGSGDIDADMERSVADNINDGETDNAHSSRIDISSVLTVPTITSSKASSVRDIVDPLRGFSASIIDGVESIYRTAILDSYTEKAFQAVLDSWTNKLFDMHYDNVHKIITCTNLTELVTYTKNALADLKSCLASPGIDFYREECENMYTQMLNSNTFVNSLINAQNEFLASKLLFSNSRTARHLNSCSAAQKACAEHFKRITQILKHDPKLSTLSNLEVHDPESGGDILVTDEMFVCLDKIQHLNDLIVAFINTQRNIYPRLYLLSDEEIKSAMMEQDVEAAYQYCARLLPTLCSIIVDPDEPINIIGGYSSAANEKILFLKPVSARMSIGELLSALDSSCTDVIRSQIEHFIIDCSDGLDYHKTMLRKNIITATIASASLASAGRLVEEEDLSLEQSRLCAIQVNFWNRLFAYVNDFGTGKADKIKTKYLLTEIKDRIVNDIDTVTSLVRSTTMKYTQVTAANTIVELINQRDFVLQCLQSIENDNNSAAIATSVTKGKAQKMLGATNSELSLSRLVENAIKKTTPDAPTTCYVVVQQNNMSFNYGYSYQGFNNALFVTPFTEKCFFALNKATQSNQICLLEGQEGTGKKSILRSLAIETGCTSFHVDASSLCSDTLRSHVLAAVGCCQWLCFYNIDTLSSALLGEMFRMLTSAQKVLDMARMLDTPGITVLEETEVQALTCTIDGISVSMSKKFIQMPIFVTVFDGTTTSKEKLLQHIPHDLLQKFRPVYCYHHSRHVLLCMLLTYCASKAGVHIPKVLNMARRLEAICAYIAAEGLSNISTALDLLIKALLLTDISSIGDMSKSSSDAKKGNKNNVMSNSIKSKEDAMLQEVMKVYLRSLPTINVMSGCLQKEHIQRLYKTICSLFLGLNTDCKAGREYIEDCLSKDLLERRSDEIASEALTTLTGVMERVHASQEDTEKEKVPQIEVDKALEAWEEHMRVNLDKKQEILLEWMENNQHRVSSTIIVGPSGVGKSELIQEVFAQVESYSKGSAIHCNKYKMNVALDTLYSVSEDYYQNSSLKVNDMVTFLSSKVLQEGFSIKNFDSFGDTHPTALVHIDLNRSEELELLCRSQEILDGPINCKHAAKMVYECEELTHASPQVLHNTPIVYIQTVLYSDRSFLDRCIVDLCRSRDKPADESYRESKHGHSSSQYIETQKSDSERREKLQQTQKQMSHKINALVEYYLIPCMSKCHKFDALMEPCVLAQQCLCMVETLLDIFSIDTYTYQQQCQEANMERIFVFALIWTFGVCSTKSREEFDAWFKYQYFHDITYALESHERAVYEHGDNSFRTTADRQILDLRRTRCPPLLDGVTVFDLVLEPIQDEAGLETHISWVLWNKYGLLKGDPRLEYLYSTYDRLPLPSRVSSLLDEERLQQAYIVGGISQGRSYDNLLLPSNDSVALSLIQGAALQSSKGIYHIISGSRGSGKTSLFQQLAMEQELDHLDRYFDVGKESALGDRHSLGCRPWALSSRWICQSSVNSATNAKNMMNCLQKGRNASLHLQKGQGSHFLGALIVEDCNLCASPSFDSDYVVNGLCPTALDVIRRIGDTKTQGDLVENVMDNTIYCLAQANTRSISMQSQWNHRLLRHFKVTCSALNEADIVSIFSAKLQEKCPQWSEDSISDMILLTRQVVNTMRQRLGANTASIYFDLVDNTSLLDSMKLLHIFQPAETAISQMLCNMAVALHSLPIFTSNDTLRIWDKVSNDYFANYFPSATEATESSSGCALLDICIDETLSDPDIIDKFRLNSFHALMRRERSARADNDNKKGLHSYLGLTSFQRNDAPDGAAMIYSWSKCEDDVREKFKRELIPYRDTISEIINRCRVKSENQYNVHNQEGAKEGKDAHNEQQEGDEHLEREKQEEEEEEQLLVGLLDSDDDDKYKGTNSIASDSPRELITDPGSIRFWSDIVRLTSALAYPSLHGNVEKLILMGPTFRMIDTCLYTSSLYMAVLAKTNAPKYSAYQISNPEDLNEVLQAMCGHFIQGQSHETKELQAAVASRRMSQFSMKDKGVVEDDNDVALWHLHIDLAPGSTPAENACNTSHLLNRDFIIAVAYLIRADLCAFATPTHVVPHSRRAHISDEEGGDVLSHMTQSTQSLFAKHNIHVYKGYSDRQLLHEYSSRQRVILSFHNPDVCAEFMHQMSNMEPSFWSDAHIKYLSCYRKVVLGTVPPNDIKDSTASQTNNNEENSLIAMSSVKSDEDRSEESSFNYRDSMMIIRRACISKDLETMRTCTARLMTDDRILIRCVRRFIQVYDRLPSRISDDEMVPGFLQGDGYNSGSSGYSSSNSRTGTPTRRSRKKNNSPDGLSVKERRKASIMTANTAIATALKLECRAYNESLSIFSNYLKQAINTQAQTLKQELYAHFAHLTRHIGFNQSANPLQKQQCFDGLFAMADTLVKLQYGLTPQVWLRRQPSADNLSIIIGKKDRAIDDYTLDAYLDVYRDLRRSLVTHITNLGSTDLENVSVLPLKLHALKYSQTLLYCLTNACRIESLYIRGESIHSEDNQNGYNLRCRQLSREEYVQQQTKEQDSGEKEVADTTGQVLYRATMKGYPTLYCCGLDIARPDASEEVKESREYSYHLSIHERSSPTAFKTNLHSSHLLHNNATATLCSLHSVDNSTILSLPVTVTACFEQHGDEANNEEVETMFSIEREQL